MGHEYLVPSEVIVTPETQLILEHVDIKDLQNQTTQFGMALRIVALDGANAQILRNGHQAPSVLEEVLAHESGCIPKLIARDTTAAYVSELTAKGRDPRKNRANAEPISIKFEFPGQPITTLELSSPDRKAHEPIFEITYQSGNYEIEVVSGQTYGKFADTVVHFRKASPNVDRSLVLHQKGENLKRITFAQIGVINNPKIDALRRLIELSSQFRKVLTEGAPLEVRLAQGAFVASEVPSVCKVLDMKVEDIDQVAYLKFLAGEITARDFAYSFILKADMNGEDAGLIEAALYNDANHIESSFGGLMATFPVKKGGSPIDGKPTRILFPEITATKKAETLKKLWGEEIKRYAKDEQTNIVVLNYIMDNLIEVFSPGIRTVLSLIN
jgi:hypothetical protein